MRKGATTDHISAGELKELLAAAKSVAKDTESNKENVPPNRRKRKVANRMVKGNEDEYMEYTTCDEEIDLSSDESEISLFEPSPPKQKWSLNDEDDISITF